MYGNASVDVMCFASRAQHHSVSSVETGRVFEAMKHYGWGIVDKNGKPTNRFLSAGNESLLVYALGILKKERPDDAPFQVVQLFYKDELSV